MIFLLHEHTAKYIQIYEHIKKLIESKKLAANDKLPSIRTLAEQLQVSRNTTLQAYETLIAEGFIRSEKKVGYFVNEIDAMFVHPNSSKLKQAIPIQQYSPNLIDFRVGAVDHHTFPHHKWRQASNAILERNESFAYGKVFGEPILQHELAHYLLQARGISAEPQQIIIGSSTQQLLLQLSILLKEDFSSVLLENPGYNGAREVFELLNFQIETIAVNQGGLALEELQQQQSSLFYVTPSHQYPFGTALSIQQRWQIVQWAEQRNGYILEDDYDGEYRYGQKTFPALASLAPARIVYFGTFSKAFLPGIRLAYMVLPASLLDAYQVKFANFENNASLLHQLAMAEFMRCGEWQRHIKRMRNTYHKKMNFFLNTLQQHFSDKVQFVGTKAGLYILLSIECTYSEEELITLALEEHVKVYPCSHLYIGTMPTDPKILIGFANLTFQQIEQGILRLKKAWGFLAKEEAYMDDPF